MIFKYEDDNEYLKSINIFNNLMIYCYNNYHLYTTEDEVYMYGIGAKIKNEEEYKDYFNINLGNNYNAIKGYQKAKECFIDCLNKIIKEKKLDILPFIKNIIDYIKKDKKNYNIIFICLRNLINENDLNNILEILNENEELPFSLIFIHINCEKDIFKLKDNILFQKYSNIISVEIEENNILDNKILYCFQQVGNNISKLNKHKKNREIIKSTNLFEDNSDDNYEEKEEEKED